MSKLDSITVGIVAICIIAILFLVYKMTDVFKSDKPTDEITTTKDSTELEDDIYDYSLDSPIDTSSNVPSTDTSKSKISNNQPSTSAPTTTPAEKNPVETTVVPASSGKYMVLAGSYTIKAHADNEASNLRKKGYNNAKVEIFDRGKYAVVLVDRFDNMAEAERLVNKLKTDGVSSYVKLKGK